MEHTCQLSYEVGRHDSTYRGSFGVVVESGSLCRICHNLDNYFSGPSHVLLVLFAVDFLAPPRDDAPLLFGDGLLLQPSRLRAIGNTTSALQFG